MPSPKAYWWGCLAFSALSFVALIYNVETGADSLGVVIIAHLFLIVSLLGLHEATGGFRRN